MFVSSKNTMQKMKLQQIRKDKGMSQPQLAELSGVNVRLIQDYEQGHKNINHAKAITLYKLAQALECSIEELLDIPRG